MKVKISKHILVLNKITVTIFRYLPLLGGRLTRQDKEKHSIF